MDRWDSNARDQLFAPDRPTRLSVSLDREASRRLRELSSGRGISKSEVLRAALMELGRPAVVGDPYSRSTGGRRGRASLTAGRDEHSGTSQSRRGPASGAPLVPTWLEDVAEAEVVSAGRVLLTPEEQRQLADLSLLTTSLVTPERHLRQGALVKANTVMWQAIVDVLRRDWREAYRIPHRAFEELIAGAFEREGYDDVVLTPRSGDDGRDVIATTRGTGCVKVIASVKRYAAHCPVGYDDVRALLGVMAAEPDTSKGMVITTSTFPDALEGKDHFRQFIPTRLELLDGERTLEWLTRLRRAEPDVS